MFSHRKRHDNSSLGSGEAWPSNDPRKQICLFWTPNEAFLVPKYHFSSFLRLKTNKSIQFVTIIAPNVSKTPTKMSNATYLCHVSWQLNFDISFISKSTFIRPTYRNSTTPNQYLVNFRLIPSQIQMPLPVPPKTTLLLFTSNLLTTI